MNRRRFYTPVVEAMGRAEAVVVASVGEFDARGVAAALELEAGYVGLVASTGRAEEVVERAADLLGVEVDEVRDPVRSPAGLDIGAETPAEIALSVLAELVQVRDSLGSSEAAEAGSAHGAHESSNPDDGLETFVDPVCGMAVDPRDAAASVEHGGETYYFCSQGCADAFVERPEEHRGTA